MVRAYVERSLIVSVAIAIESVKLAHMTDVKAVELIITHIEHLYIHQLRKIYLIDIYTLQVKVVDLRGVTVDFHDTLRTYLTVDDGTLDIPGCRIYISHTDFIFHRSISEINVDIHVLGRTDSYSEGMIRAILFIQ